MAEGEQDRETKTIAALFPLGKEPVLAAFRALSPLENSSAQEAVNEETEIFRETNPHAFNQFVGFAQEMKNKKVAEEAINQMFWGAMVCHRVLREQAKLKGGVLPKLTTEFIEEYNEEGSEKTRAMSVDKGITVQQVASQLSNMDLVAFENWEPEFSQIVTAKLGLQSDLRRAKDLKYTGIVDLYCLFREGCSDPKNFQKINPLI